ncbi:MAG: seg [Parcubacteria group bacterium]|nr:seg [Parcubacteria group bacterium]
MSIIGNKSAVRTPEFHKKKERQRYIKNTVVFFIVAALVALPIYLLRTQKFLIQNIRLAGNNVTKSEDIQKIVAEDMAGNILWLFPRSNIALYPRKQIETDLLRMIPRLASVDISLNDTHSMTVTVAEREPVALYCKDISHISAPASCFFIDDQGYIFSEAPSFSDGVYNIFSSIPVIEEPLGASYMSPASFAPLNPFLKSINNAGMYPKVFLSKDGEYDLVLANGGIVMIKSNADLDLVRSNLASLIVDPSFRKDNNSLDTLLYIDLRFGNKIFYKFRDNS